MFILAFSDLFDGGLRGVYAVFSTFFDLCVKFVWVYDGWTQMWMHPTPFPLMIFKFVDWIYA